LRRENVEGQECAHAGVFCDDKDFTRRIDRVDVDDDRSQTKQSECRNHVLRTIRQHDADAIALFYAKPRKCSCKPISLVP
jgi:hypothetical protein